MSPEKVGGCRKVKISRRALPAGVGLVSLVVAAIGLAPGALAAPSPGYRIADVGAYGGEPSIAADTLGQLYVTTPQGGTITYTSSDLGSNWRQVTTADPSSGDDCLA